MAANMNTAKKCFCMEVKLWCVGADVVQFDNTEELSVPFEILSSQRVEPPLGMSMLVLLLSREIAVSFIVNHLLKYCCPEDQYLDEVSSQRIELSL